MSIEGDIRDLIYEETHREGLCEATRAGVKKQKIRMVLPPMEKKNTILMRLRTPKTSQKGRK